MPFSIARDPDRSCGGFDIAREGSPKKRLRDWGHHRAGDGAISTTRPRFGRATASRRPTGDLNCGAAQPALPTDVRGGAMPSRPSGTDTGSPHQLHRRRTQLGVLMFQTLEPAEIIQHRDRRLDRRFHGGGDVSDTFTRDFIGAEADGEVAVPHLVGGGAGVGGVAGWVLWKATKAAFSWRWWSRLVKVSVRKNALFAQLSRVLALAPRWPGWSATSQAEEHHNRAPEPDHVLVGQAPDAFTELGARRRRNLVNHQTACYPQAVLIVGNDREPNQRCLGRIGGERAHGHRVRSVKPIVLNDHHGSRLTRIATPGCGRPDLCASHSSRLRASMNA